MRKNNRLYEFIRLILIVLLVLSGFALMGSMIRSAASTPEVHRYHSGELPMYSINEIMRYAAAGIEDMLKEKTEQLAKVCSALALVK